MFGREIGDAFILHGFIAITLFARIDLVERGAVTVVSLGPLLDGSCFMDSWFPNIVLSLLYTE